MLEVAAQGTPQKAKAKAAMGSTLKVIPTAQQPQDNERIIQKLTERLSFAAFGVLPCHKL